MIYVVLFRLFPIICMSFLYASITRSHFAASDNRNQFKAYYDTFKLVTFNSFTYYASVDSVVYNNSLKKINNTVKAIVPANLVYCIQAFK